MTAGLIFGLLDTSGDIAEPLAAEWARELTIAWSRFKYFDSILENTSVNGILDQLTDSDIRSIAVQRIDE